MQETLLHWAGTSDGGLLLAIFAVLFIASGLVLVPRPVLCTAAGLIYGMAAFPFVVGITTLSAILAFLLSRYLFRDRVLRMIERRPGLRTMVQAVDREGWRLLALLRLASPVPAFISNYSFGVTGMRLWPFTLTTALGSAPQIFIFLYLGSIGRIAMQDETVSNVRLGLAIAGFVGLFLCAALVTRRVRRIVQARLETAEALRGREEAAEEPLQAFVQPR